MNFVFKIRDARVAARQQSEDRPPEQRPANVTSDHRRRQLRIAQRKHRDRKDAYVEALQKEAAQLRKLYAASKRENAALKQYIVNTIGCLPAEFTSPPPRDSKQGSSMSPASSPSSDKVLTDSGSGGSSPVYSIRRKRSLTGKPLELTTQTPALTTSDDRDSLIGVNWVLMLERPCLNHVQEVEEPHGTHAHMISGQLISLSPPGLNYADPQDWYISQASLNNLLELSKTFILDEEITPVQAWFMLKTHPRFSSNDRVALNTLANTIYKHVKCYGFGAVIDRTVWDRAVFNVYGST